MNTSPNFIEAGVFLPTKSSGWIHSVNVPHTPGTYEHVRDVAVLAENLGFDFILSPANWRGRKGPSRNSQESLESLTASAGLLQATSRISVWGTAHATVFPPAIIAKMLSTLDQIGPGRVGLNVVTGGSKTDLAHLGMWNDVLNHDEKYDLAEEWITVIKGLWTKEVLDHAGSYFSTEGATMGPKPSKMPTLINAGASTRGLRFAAENCNVAFVAAGDDPKAIETARNVKVVAESVGRPELRCYGVISLIPGETDADAQARMEHLEAGADRESLQDVKSGYEQNKDFSKLSAASLAVAGGEKMSPVLPGTLIGSYETLAERIAYVVKEGRMDGILLTVPDYISDLEAVATRTIPLLPEFGVTTNFAARTPVTAQ
ncbi:LLM class flavin-dependent oxidoreductase [Rhodococcus sp. NPDC055024]